MSCSGRPKRTRFDAKRWTRAARLRARPLPSSSRGQKIPGKTHERDDCSLHSGSEDAQSRPSKKRRCPEASGSAQGARPISTRKPQEGACSTEQCFWPRGDEFSERPSRRADEKSPREPSCKAESSHVCATKLEDSCTGQRLGKRERKQAARTRTETQTQEPPDGSSLRGYRHSDKARKR